MLTLEFGNFSQITQAPIIEPLLTPKEKREKELIKRISREVAAQKAIVAKLQRHIKKEEEEEEILIKQLSTKGALEDIDYKDLAVLVVPFLYFTPKLRGWIAPLLMGYSIYRIAELVDKKRQNK